MSRQLPGNMGSGSGGGVTGGIQALISKLRGANLEEPLGPDEQWIRYLSKCGSNFITKMLITTNQQYTYHYPNIVQLK